MDKTSAIQFGAYLQKAFKMKPGFSVVEVTQDHPGRIRLYAPPEIDFISIQSIEDIDRHQYENLIEEDVDLEEIATNRPPVFECLRAGYSRITNTLVFGYVDGTETNI